MAFGISGCPCRHECDNFMNYDKFKNEKISFSNFEVTGWNVVNNFIIVLVKYEDCNHFEGNKILVYENVNLKDILNSDKLDPHFCDNDECISPIARFKPTESGYSYAVSFCESIKK